MDYQATTIKLPREMRDKIESFAESKGMIFSSALRFLVSEGMISLDLQSPHDREVEGES